MKRTLRTWALIASVAALLFGLGSPASAYSQAFFPTTSSGNRGTDVVALQHLLNQAGQSVATDGVFGSGTTTAVRNVQTAKGLTVDGIVGPATWGALAVTVQSGSNGSAVKALQYQLNAKRGAGLVVDGAFGPATDSAVRSFQSHAGIGVDGVVGPTTWKNLLWHYENVNFGTGTMCAQSPDGNANAHWGTASGVGQLEAGAASFAGTGNGKLPVGDSGFEHGGAIPGHASHQDGLDFDVWPIRTDSAQCTAGRITWQSSTYDRAATRQLVQAIRAAAPGHVKLIFFNDPQLIAEGLTTQYANHDNHLHIRYCEKVHPDSLYDC
ncbi:penicillin-insensitive murein endopeptidase [Streptomyces sp. NPDC051940]|uniref:penicillin-insensitive murein endopeptidase n=1 Tax=Streptomyces sp. NPDC051940 TaxID=3155675 RepID=UPI003448CAAA